MRGEKRLFTRKEVQEPGEVVFYLQGELYFGTIINLSPTGLCVSIHAAGHAAGRIPPTGEKIDCCITGEHGTSKCRGEIRWSVADGKVVHAGLSLLKVPDEEDDPWRITLARHYRTRMSMTRPATGEVSIAGKMFAVTGSPC